MTEEQNCEEQVFPLAVNLLDRFLAVSLVQRCQLQLLGCVCLLAATKLRQCRPIGVDLLVYYTDYSVTANEIRVSCTFPPTDGAFSLAMSNFSGKFKSISAAADSSSVAYFCLLTFDPRSRDPCEECPPPPPPPCERRVSSHAALPRLSGCEIER